MAWTRRWLPGSAGLTSMEMKAKPEHREIEITISPFRIRGTLCLPQDTAGIVLVCDGDRRRLRRRRSLAQAMPAAGLGVLSLDLMTREEGRASGERGADRFAADMLAGRLLRASDWASATLGSPALGYLGIGLAGTAAIVAASERGADVRAVVAITSRPDLALEALGACHAPTLFLTSRSGARRLPAPLPAHVTVALAGRDPVHTDQHATAFFRRHLAPLAARPLDGGYAEPR